MDGLETGRQVGQSPKRADPSLKRGGQALRHSGRALEHGGQEFKYVGKSPRRGDLIDKVTGKLVYGADFTLPGMLHGKALRSPYPHARIVSIDVERARRLPGVCAAITSDDLPDHRFGSSIQDEPFLARGKVRYAGEPVAAVAAISKDIARKAIDLIDVEYEELPGVYDALEAMRPDSVLVHEGLGEYEMEGVYNRYPGTNIVGHTKIRRGDVEQGFADADEVYEDVFTTQNVQHCSMEPHVGIAKVDEDGSVTVWTSCQSPYNALRDMANALGLPHNKIRVICTDMGGGFGGKNYLRIEPLVVALASHANGRPVKVAFTRDEEFIASVCKHPVHLTFKTGVKRDGTIRRAQDQGGIRHRRVCRHGSARGPQRRVQRIGAVPDTQRVGGFLLRLHEQPAGRLVPGLRRAAAHLGARVADGHDRREARHRPR